MLMMFLIIWAVMIVLLLIFLHGAKIASTTAEERDAEDRDQLYHYQPSQRNMPWEPIER